MPPKSGFGNQPQSRAVRITAVGHASARWRAAKNKAEADRLNLALSNQRANNVRVVVEQILRREIPNVTIASGSDSLAPGQHPTGVQVGWYGVGSRAPLTHRPTGPDENDPVNRSVTVVLELITTTYGQSDVCITPLRIGARTQFWRVKVIDLIGGAVGAASYFCRLAISNTLSGKTATYSGFLFGGGVGAGISKTPTKPTYPNEGIGDEVLVETDDEMGFDDFSGQMIRIEKASAGLGIKATISYLTFTSLGSGASLLPFEKKIGLGLVKNLEAFVVAGTVNMEGQNPGDWLEVDRTDSIPVTTDQTQGDGIIISFPTEKAGVNDLNTKDRKMLDDFVASWARRF